MPVGEICSREVLISRKGVSILELTQLMRKYHKIIFPYLNKHCIDKSRSLTNSFNIPVEKERS